MSKQKFFPLSVIHKGGIYDEIFLSIKKAVEAATLGNSELSARNLDFIRAINNGVTLQFFGTYQQSRLFFSLPFDEDIYTKTGGISYVRSGIVGAMQMWAERYIKRETLATWHFLEKGYNVGEYGKTTSKSTTNATGTSEQTNTGETSQKFSNGAATATTGTANKTATSESANGLTTGLTEQSTEQGFALEYAGRPDEIIKANTAGAPVVNRIVQGFGVLVWSVENLDDDEKATPDEISY